MIIIQLKWINYEQGLPLHLQIDTYDDPRDATPVFHRGYDQVKVFCDKVINSWINDHH